MDKVFQIAAAVIMSLIWIVMAKYWIGYEIMTLIALGTIFSLIITLKIK